MYFDIMFLFCFSLMMLAGRRVAAGVARPLPRAWIQVLPMVFLVKPCLLFPGGASGKEPACQCRRGKGRRFNPWEGEIPWSRKWQPTPVFLLGESHGQRSLAGYRGHQESDMTEQLTFSLFHVCYLIQSFLLSHEVNRLGINPI